MYEIPERVWREAMMAVDPGAVNVSGLVHSLPDMIEHVESVIGKTDKDLKYQVRVFRKVLDAAWVKVFADDTKGTGWVNTHPNVKRQVKRLALRAFEREHLNPVASHPVLRLVISQMMELAGVTSPEPGFFIAWGSAYAEVKKKLDEFENERTKEQA